MGALRTENRAVIFIGDSITDCGRTYPSVSEFGHGYAAMCISRLRECYPHLTMYNRGVAGQCIGQVFERWNKDCLDLKPALVSILIGINDVDFSYRHENHPFIEKELHAQLQEMFRSVRDAGSYLVVLEPYAFHGELYKDDFWPRLSWLKETTKALAERYADVFIPAPMRSDLTMDGLHPTQEGHQLIYATWMEATRNLPLFTR